MNSPEDEELDLLAGEYVIGTLSEPQRRMVEAIYQQDASFRQRVVAWQTRLAPLDTTATPIKPAAHNWPSIAGRLKFAGYGPVQSDNLYTDPQTQPRGNVWQVLTGFATAAALLLGVLLWDKVVNVPPELPVVAEYSAVSVVTDDTNAALWLVDSQVDTSTLRITALSPPEPNTEESYQLWLVLDNDAGVSSLGLLELTEGQTDIRTVNATLADGIAFAVSREPAGGSPSAVPTGPVLYQGVITTLSE